MSSESVSLKLTEGAAHPALKLKPYQKEHFDRVQNILSKFYFYIDGSEQSTGKTYVATATAINLNLPVIVVCPAIAKHVWEEVLTTYGVQVYQLPETCGIMTYDALRSRKNYYPKHGLLIREDGRDGVKFHATPMLNEIVQTGVLIIFDECQKIKNVSAQSKATKAIIHSLYSNGGISRAAFLSGTPMDKDEQIVNFVKMAGFITRRNLYTKIKGEIREEGIDELKTWATRINAKAAQEFIQNNSLVGTKTGAIKYIYKMFLKVIRPGIMSIMPNELNKMKDIKNGYYVMDAKGEKDYQEAISQLSNATNYDPTKNFAVIDGNNMGDITRSLVKIQIAKVNSLIRVCRKILDEEKYNEKGEKIESKIVIFSNYHDVIDPLLAGLFDYNPVAVTGRILEKKKVENIKAFQEQNSKVRVFIGNLVAAGVAINLHDVTGLYPRVTFIMPDYRINEIVQAAARTVRPGIVEKVKIRMFYGKSGMIENSIISALNRKGKVMRKITIEQTNSGAKFPDQYEDEVEDDKKDEVQNDKKDEVQNDKKDEVQKEEKDEVDDQ